MKRLLFILSIHCFVISFCLAQVTYMGHFRLKNDLKNHILLDRQIKTKFILDSVQVYISAMDSTGKEAWQTDPWKDNNIKVYRVKRPIIIYFDFGKDIRDSTREVIRITYNNSQFGFIDKQTGTFRLLGQD
jgi:hypothetical protein